ncbi:DUF2933 domain-containing protein [Novosphingobium sp.]|uniref:DUF2933 domain-containing protein n=1 Tax=Novosphingobium sp. TaxID=1874826 RepID=UPI002625B32B|nr:DUF2933 domain-containing protein [Novosphingobium sp.]
MNPKTNIFAQLLIGAVVSAAAFWVIEKHWQHALGLLPYVLFLTCPLMHLLMHHGTGRHHQAGEDYQSGSR